MILQEDYILLNHCSHCNEPTQAKCAYRSKNKATGNITEYSQYFCHMCIHMQLQSMHVSSVLRMAAMCTCVFHYVDLFESPPPSHDIKVLKRDIDGDHYDGEVYIMPPPSSLRDHVRQTFL